MQKLELLAPARDADTAIEAIRHGADAVYIGAEAFGARSAAGNSVESIRRVCQYAHCFDAKVYVTVNTIIYDNELEAARKLVWELYHAGVDALIVQDMALLRLNLPPIALHASTQCDTRDPAKARFLEQAGFSQLVLARELSLDEISAIRAATSVPLEVFVHGALCVSYSGDCHAGALSMGRSANRGECPQICRLRYSLSDSRGRRLAADGHWLSLRDMNRLDSLAELARAGASSFKIEGRLKDVAYVKNVVASYSRALDALVATDPQRWRRASVGRTELHFQPDPGRAFNRGFTSYFLGGRPASDVRMAASATPKYVGRNIGCVQTVRGNRISLKSCETLANGDGIGWFGADGRLCGARVNRADGNTLYLAEKPADLSPGTTVYRNRDKAWDELMAMHTATRTIDVEFTLRPCADGRVALDAADCRGNRVSVAMEVDLRPARTQQEAKRRDTLGRLGDSIYRAAGVSDRIGDRFMPVSALVELRRRAIEQLDRAQRIRFHSDIRRKEDTAADAGSHSLSYHANVANRMARDFYQSHGVTDIEPAAEIRRPAGEPVVMTTRYCLRRELGQCIRCGASPGSWFLQATDGNVRMRADFDCARCGMTIHLL